MSSIDDTMEFPLQIKAPLDIGLIIRHQRRSLGLSQTQLARTAGVGRQWLVAVEQGKSGAELGLVLRTLSALGLALSVDGATAPADPVAPIDIDTIVEAARGDRT
jgi:HTH-type transcriptional regulator/antitoxin HipB